MGTGCILTVYKLAIFALQKNRVQRAIKATIHKILKNKYKLKDCLSKSKYSYRQNKVIG